MHLPWKYSAHSLRNGTSALGMIKGLPNGMKCQFGAAIGEAATRAQLGDAVLGLLHFFANSRSSVVSVKLLLDKLGRRCVRHRQNYRITAEYSIPPNGRR